MTVSRCVVRWRLQNKLSPRRAWVRPVGGTGAGRFVLLCGGFRLVQLLDSRSRQHAERTADHAPGAGSQARQRRQPGRHFALMNELQTGCRRRPDAGSDGDRRHHGAIADSVNYTVEELRQLVGSVQNTVTRVAQTTAHGGQHVHRAARSVHRAAAEIRETGRRCWTWQVESTKCPQGEESRPGGAPIAASCDSGLQAVQNAIGGMNSIRDQIQEPPSVSSGWANRRRRSVKSRTDFRHYRADERAGPERRHPGRVCR